MLLVDYRRGSQELIEPLRKRGLEVVETDLPSADIAFEGRGAGGKVVDIGIEFKKLPELIQAFRTGRLQGHQLLKMVGGDDPTYHYAWLLIEGDVRYDAAGRLLKRVGRADFRPMPGQMSISELQKRLLTMDVVAHLRPLLVRSRHETLTTIESLYRFWTDKDLDDHRSHMDVHQPVGLKDHSQFVTTVHTFPGVGLRVAKAAESVFEGSIRRAVNATPAEWAEITTTHNGRARRFGHDAARHLDEVLQ